MKGLIFGPESMRAHLDGRKRMTRRVVMGADRRPLGGNIDRIVLDDDAEPRGRAWACYGAPGDERCATGYHYGYEFSRFAVGDLFYAKEAWRWPVSLDGSAPSEVYENCLDAGYRLPWAPILWEADGATSNEDCLRNFGGEWGRTRNPLFMPEWASRFRARVTEVRVERLHDITKEDAIAEGFDPEWRKGEFNSEYAPKLWYSERWDAINGKRHPWASNPWVWVYGYEEVKP